MFRPSMHVISTSVHSVHNLSPRSQNSHLDFHTTPELCKLPSVCVPSDIVFQLVTRPVQWFLVVSHRPGQFSPAAKRQFRETALVCRKPSRRRARTYAYVYNPLSDQKWRKSPTRKGQRHELFRPRRRFCQDRVLFQAGCSYSKSTGLIRLKRGPSSSCHVRLAGSPAVGPFGQSPSLSPAVSSQRECPLYGTAEFRSCVTVEVAVLGFPS